MRIVAGEFRGRAIDAPPGEGTRPTTDRVREALFSSLYSLRGGFEGAEVLDAFAGSGALGLEALSRGARRAVFYERDATAASTLKRNIAACKADEAHAQLAQKDVMQFPPGAQAYPFDLIFLDPPYDYDAGRVLAMVVEMANGGAIADEAVVVYEHALKSSDDVQRAAEQSGFLVHKFKKYGKTGVTILIWKAR